jgi:alkanesulfonate monooxygenase SsuD/methylene tetrahydromethanopterin reductase-like flavin-dependent oxidoreductase (luciferase family)
VNAHGGGPAARGGRLLHLAAAVDPPGDAAGRGPYAGDPGVEAGPDARVDACVDLARLAESGGLDFVTFGDPDTRSGPDAPALLSRVASATGRIGLVTTLTAVRGTPGRAVAAHSVLPALAALDGPAHDRAGWLTGEQGLEAAELGPVRGRGTEGAAGEQPDEHPASGAYAPDGRAARPPYSPYESHDSYELYDSSGGQAPDSLPHPLVRVVDVTAPRTRRLAARCADVVLVRASTAAQAAEAGDELRSLAARSGRDPRSLRVLAALRVDLGGGEYAAEPAHGGGGPRPTTRGPLYRGGPVGLAELVTAWHGVGAVDGFHLTPVTPRRDLERLVNGTVALLQHRGLFRTFYPGGTLREHLGLVRPAPRPAAAREAR